MHVSGVHPLFLVILLGAISLAVKSRSVFAEGKAPVSPCKPLCAIFLRKASMYSFSPVKANVGRLCEKLKIGMRNGWWIKFMVAALPTFSLLLIVGSTENREMYVYKSTAESRVANVVDWSDFAGSTRPRCGRGRKAPCFAV